MTPAVSSKPAAAPAPSQPAKVIFQGRINLDLIDVKEQVRKRFDENAHRELAESVRTKDVINPITLRPSKTNGRFELVAGERRFRAAVAAKIVSIPAVVRELDDQAAALYQVEENIHRKDLTPIEEARGFKLLTQPSADGKDAKYSVEQLAKLVDKSTAYVYRAVHLLDLPNEVVAEIEIGDLSPAHGHQLLRLPPQERKGWLGRARQMTAKQLAERIGWDEGTSLDKAKFDIKKPFAGEVACTACPYNSGNQGALFDGAEKGRCMNGACFERKNTAVRKEKLDELRKKYPTAGLVSVRPGYIFSGEKLGTGFIIRGEFDGKPPKGEFELVLSSNEDKVYIALPDKTKSKPEAPPKPADPKDAFVQEETAKALYRAAAEATKKLKMTIEDWRLLAENAANDLPDAILQDIIGIKDSVYQIAKASEAQLRVLVLLNLHLPYQPGDADWKKLGVDVAKVKKQAATQAKLAWDCTWGRKHRSVGNGGSLTACGLKTLNHKTATVDGIAVPLDEDVTCPDCKKSAHMKR